MENAMFEKCVFHRLSPDRWVKVNGILVKKIKNMTIDFVTKEAALKVIQQLRDKPKKRIPPADLNFKGVSLRGEDLTGLNLIGANFVEADLSEADLSSAQLFKADFSKASLVMAKLNDVRPKYQIENRLRQASLTGSDDKGVEAIARNQKLIELELLDEDQFNAEIDDAIKKKDLATLQLATMAVKQRKYKDGAKASILKSEISGLLLPETKILEEMDEKIRDLESAVQAINRGVPDKRRKMHQAVNRYRKKQAEKGAE